jgi:chromosome segregation ATPase
MSESFEQSIVSLLEEHVELAISTVQQLRAEKLDLEAEIARLNSDVLQRDAQIQELEDLNSDLKAELELERSTTSQERADVRERLENLMDVLAASNESTTDTGDEIAFSAENDAPDAAPSQQTEDDSEV